jgi:hypothetical protein
VPAVRAKACISCSQVRCCLLFSANTLFSKPTSFKKLAEHVKSHHKGKSGQDFIKALCNDLNGEVYTGPKLQPACQPAPTAKDVLFFDKARVFPGKSRAERDEKEREIESERENKEPARDSAEKELERESQSERENKEHDRDSEKDSEIEETAIEREQTDGAQQKERRAESGTAFDETEDHDEDEDDRDRVEFRMDNEDDTE